MADLVTGTSAREEETPVAGSESEDTSDIQKVVIVKIPSRFMEEKVKTLMGSMEAQFENTGYKVVFAPEEVDVYILGQEPPVSLRSRY